MSKTRDILNEMAPPDFDPNQYGDEFDMWWKGEPERHTYKSNYAKASDPKDQHPMDKHGYGEWTDGELVDDLLQPAVERLGGLIDRGEQPNYEVRALIIQADELVNQALELVDQ